MPLINGQKMACEPCIRGHRSTKCTHANERLMVPVRKPGRPLSSCPHPSSRACACAAVTAAIPRNQKCRCGSSQATTAGGDNDRDTSSGGITPPSPSKASANSAFRVQKQASKSTPSRKQSIDPVGIERMDASQLNILPAYNGMQRLPVSDGHAITMPDMSTYGAMGLAPTETPFSPESAMFPMFQYPMQSSPMAKPIINDRGGPSTDGSTTESAAVTPDGCCGDSTGRIQAQAATRHMSTSASAVDGAGEKKPSSCSSASADPHEAKRSRTEPIPAPAATQQPSGVMMPLFQPPMAMPNGMYAYFPQPTIFNYPPQFGSHLQPLQPEQWRQLMAAMSFGQPVPPATVGMTESESFHSPGTPNGASWTSHQCSCGDSCQCIGCAVHPYNEATRNYVRSAWNTVAEEGQKLRAHSNGHTNPANGKINGGHERSMSLASTGVSTPITGQAEGTISPTAPQTPSDGTSGVIEEQTLSASDFFFVSYPFGDTCAGETASCPCGDDCQCIGCVIHGNTGPEQTAEDPSHL